MAEQTVREAAKVLLAYTHEVKGTKWQGAHIPYSSARACDLALCDLMDRFRKAETDEERKRLQAEIAAEQEPWQTLARLTDHLNVTASVCRRILAGEL